MSSMATNMKYEYMNKEIINEDLLCPVCKDPLIDPVSTKCTPNPHTFCRQCIEKWIKTNLSCPFPSCSHKLHTKDLTSVAMVNFINMLNNLLVHCLDCKQTGLKRIDFDAHYNKICPKVNIKCPSSDIICSWTGTRDQLDEHLKICIINLLKPLIVGFQRYRVKAEELITRQQQEIETLRTEKKQSQQRVNKPQIPIRKPMTPHQPFHHKRNDQQTEIPVNSKSLEQVMDDVDLPLIINKLYEYQTQMNFDIEMLQNENRQLKLQQQQQQHKPKNPTKKLRNQQNYSHKDEGQTKSHDGHAATSIFDRINNGADNTVFSATHNPLPPDYHSPDGINHIDLNSINNFLNSETMQNSSGDDTQNLYKHPVIVPYVITPISFHTNIAGGNNNAGTGGSNTNIAGGSTNNDPGSNNNNIANGSNNNVCGGNNNAGGNNNNIAGGNHNNIATTNNTIGRKHAVAFGNVPGNNYGSRMNNLADNNHTVSGNNNITNGNGNNITGGNNHADGSNHNIAGGNANVAPNNINDYNLRNNIADDEDLEDSIDNCGVSVAESRRVGSTYSGDRIRQNPQIVSPTTDNNFHNS